jgi:hypothetical protein
MISSIAGCCYDHRDRWRGRDGYYDRYGSGRYPTIVTIIGGVVAIAAITIMTTISFYHDEAKG